MGISPYVNLIGKNAVGIPTVLPAEDRSFHSILYQTDEATTFDEFNLVQAIWNDRLQRFGKTFSKSGWVDPGAFITPGDTNVFYIPKTNVMVNGNPLTIADPDGTGERVSVNLTSSATRRDIIFLEVWLQEVAPSGSAEADDEDVRHYGGDDNVALSNDILRSFAPDRNGGKETTRRVQIRWRIREVTDIDFGTDPDGMDDPLVLAQGGTAAPVAGKTFTIDPDDANLWIAGTGSEADGIALDSVDGYVYAIRIADLTRTAADEDIDAGEINADLRDQATINLNLIQLITEVDSANPWKMFFGDGASDIQEVTIGVVGQSLVSTGLASAPVFAERHIHAAYLNLVLDSPFRGEFISLGGSPSFAKNFADGDHVGAGFSVRESGDGTVNLSGASAGWQLTIAATGSDAGFTGGSAALQAGNHFVLRGSIGGVVETDCVCIFGFKVNGTNDFSDLDDFVGFRVLSTGGNVFGVCDDGGTETTRDTGIASGDPAEIHAYEIRINFLATIVQFFVDGVQVGADVTTNIPTGILFPSCGISNGGVANQVSQTIFDLFNVQGFAGVV